MSIAERSGNGDVKTEPVVGTPVEVRDTDAAPVARLFHADFRQHKGFDSHWNIDGLTKTSKVAVSICEVGNFSGEVKPFQGAASMEIHNVVPEANLLRVRGFIGWERDLDVRLHIIVF
jgi:hypothetical protein